MKLILLFCLIYGLSQVTTNNYNILEILKAKNITCNLRSFIISSNLTSNNDYQMFIDDLNKYCWNSSAGNVSDLICHMLAIELEIACVVFNQSRIVPIVYNSQYTSKQICSTKSVILTNNWIWEQLTVEEKSIIGSSSINLCSVVTMNNETFRLSRFFYRLAPRVRRSNLKNSTLLTNLTTPISLNVTKVTVLTPISSVNQTSTKTNESEANNPAQEPMLEGVLPKEVLNAVKEEILINNENMNETKLSEEGAPLGRAGEKPEREQINERPKPKPLDANVVFKQNVEDDRNWVQGKNIDNKLQDPMVNHLNKLPNIQVEDAAAIVPQGVKKRPLFRLKFNRHSDDSDGNEDLSHSFVTSILVAILCFVLLYLILHNKNKILGLIIEGCKRQHRGKNLHHVRLSQATH